MRKLGLARLVGGVAALLAAAVVVVLWTTGPTVTAERGPVFAESTFLPPEYTEPVTVRCHPVLGSAVLDTDGDLNGVDATGMPGWAIFHNQVCDRLRGERLAWSQLAGLIALGGLVTLSRRCRRG